MWKRRQQASKIFVAASMFTGIWVGLGLPFVHASIQTQTCPVFLGASQLPMRSKYLSLRQQLRLYTFHSNSSGHYWQPVSLQIDPHDRLGRMSFPDPSSFMQEKLSRSDRISLDPAQFHEGRYERGSRWPCGANHGVEVSVAERFAYLFLCDKDQLLPLPHAPVQYQASKGRIASDRYFYQHRLDNHLMFESLGLVQASKNKAVALNSDQLIYNDIQNFINLSFDADDIEAKLESLRFGPMGLVGLLRFYLSIMALKIELSLTPEIQFFPSSLYMPMSLHAPVNAQDYLNPGSAVYYSWQSAEDVEWDMKKSQIPLHASEKSLELGDYCKLRTCTFSLVGRLEDNEFTLRFLLPRSLAILEFYPRLIPDLRQEEKRLGRPLSGFQKGQRMGLVFATHRLPQGNHDWDFWVFFGDSQQNCPRHAKLRRISRPKPKSP